VKGWDTSGNPLELQPWQELAVLGLLGWDEGERTVTLISRARGEGKTVVLYTTARYVAARAKGRPLRDDPIRGRGQEGDSS